MSDETNENEVQPEAVRIVRDIPVKLTDDERLAKGDELVAAQTEYNELQAEKTNLTAQQKPIKKKVDKLVRLLKAGQEMRPVTCEKRMLDATNEVSIVRLDTYEEIERRTQSPEERQQSFRVIESPEPSEDEELAGHSAIVQPLFPALTADEQPTQ